MVEMVVYMRGAALSELEEKLRKIDLSTPLLSEL
jgi:hypothetical protein